MPLNSLYHANTTAGKFSHVVIVGTADNYFSNTTTATMADPQPGAPTLTVDKVIPFSNNRYLLIRYKAVKQTVVAPPGDGDAVGTATIQTGAVSVSITNPTTSTTVGVAYYDDTET
ncbi:MAG: hypothetical protein U0798_19740 [Gemmataceae bacterium]